MDVTGIGPLIQSRVVIVYDVFREVGIDAGEIYVLTILLVSFMILVHMITHFLYIEPYKNTSVGVHLFC